MNDIRATFAQQGLVRSSDSAILGGVCAGLGRRLGLTPWVARLLFVLLLVVVPGSPAPRLPRPVDPDARRGQPPSVATSPVRDQ